MLAPVSTARPKVALPVASLFQSAHAVVPVETYESYGNAIALAQAVVRDIALVTARRGPLVPASRLDRWMDSALVRQEIMPQSIAAGGLGSLMLLPAVWLHSGPWTNPIPAAVYWALGGLSFVAFCAGIYMRRADVRIAKHEARVASERFSVSDIDAMLASFQKAPATLQAVTRHAIAAQMAPLRRLMEAEAQTRLDSILAGESYVHSEARVAEVARLAMALVSEPPTPSLIARVKRVLAEAAGPGERCVIAARLEGLLGPSLNSARDPAVATLRDTIATAKRDDTPTA